MSKKDEEYQIHDIPLSELHVDYTFNSRGEVSPYQVLSLAESIQSGGLQTPVTVEPWDKISGKKWRLIAGFRRHKAFEYLKKTHIPAFIKTNLSESAVREYNIVENIERQQLNRVQEAEALKYYFDQGYDNDMLATKFKKTTKWVELRRIILKLPENIKKLAAVPTILSDAQILAFDGMTQERQIEIVNAMQNNTLRMEMFGIKQKATKGQRLNKNYLHNAPPTDAQIEALKMAMFHSMGPCVATAVLGWVQGHTTIAAIWKYVRDEFDKSGYELEIPEDVEFAINSI